MTAEEREAALRALAAQHARLEANRGRRLVAPAPDIHSARVARSPFRLGRAVGWNLPNRLRLFAWAGSGKPVAGGFELDSIFRGFIGRVGGYADDIGRAVRGGLLGGLPVMWESAWGDALPLRWVGPTRPEAEYSFLFGGTQADLDELFRRARRFANEHPSRKHAEPGAAPDPAT
jgi:hypothetical protein